MEWAEVGHHSDRDCWISECRRVLRPPLSHHGVHLYGDGSFLDFLYLSALKLLLCSEKPSYLPSLNIPQAENGRDSRSVDLWREGAWLRTSAAAPQSMLKSCRPRLELSALGVILPTNSPWGGSFWKQTDQNVFLSNNKHGGSRSQRDSVRL